MKEYILQALADNIPVFLTGGFTLLGAIGGGIISSRTTRKNNKQKLLHEKRADLYSDFYEVVEKVWNDRTKIFDNAYFDEIKSYKARMKLLSSKGTFNAFKSFYEYIRAALRLFEKFCSENDPEQNPDYVQTDTDENGEECTWYNVHEDDLLFFETQKIDYIRTHVPPADEMNKYVNTLFEEMRKDLGSKE